MEARVNDTKKQLFEAGKKAQKAKDGAKAAFQEEPSKEENQSFRQWVEMNYPELSADYQVYEAAVAAYSGALHAYSSSQGIEWQKKKQQKHNEKMRGNDEFEKVFIIILPEDGEE
ncbi:hypothetical protein FLONG3_6425 [Fusarium longipes]|uniref:Uncharacterized protein n=1 Tax=Fusarium longipes TaxID=694270 RepID=A0A395SLX9_9HYPO|nr:hypothetical protein FLONG3_6425 [Fusarium longipes]